MPSYDTICFTGGRPKSLFLDEPYNPKNYKLMSEHISDFILPYAKDGCRRFISGGAQGFDMLAFAAVELIKQQYPDIRNVVCVPFKGQSRRWPKRGIFSQEEYAKMLSRADEIIIVNNIDCEDYYACVKALYARNEFMVDNADLVIAQYPDDSWCKAKSGTAACLRYAEKSGKPIIRHDFR